jgi:hypothetical protein
MTRTTVAAMPLGNGENTPLSIEFR